MDIFKEKSAKPMLIGRNEPAFSDPDYLYELKLDGERCLAYLDEKSTLLVNQRGTRVTSKLPELAKIYKQADGPCILDGELVVLTEGKPDFERIISRTQTKGRLQIELAAAKAPASFVVFDILYHKGENLTGLPLELRKARLAQVVVENERISIARTLPERGEAFFALACEQGLEGVVGKRLGSLYQMGKRSKDWVKFKNMQDDEFVICGYITQAEYVASLVLGQYDKQGRLLYRGHVTLGFKRADYAVVEKQPRAKGQPFAEPPPAGNENAIWLKPELVCTVQYTQRNESGLVRHPNYKGLRPDKHPRDAIDYYAM